MKVTVVVPNKAQAIICGVEYARVFSSGVVQLVYPGGATESAHLTVWALAAGRDDFFKLVEGVQAYRPNTLRFPL